MSKLETPMIRWYWQQVGGTLVEEFCAVPRANDCSNRLIDGLIVKAGEFRIAKQSEIKIKDEDVVVLQAKARRLGMYLMGQAFFSAQLIQRFGPRSIESVALVTKMTPCCVRFLNSTKECELSFALQRLQVLLGDGQRMADLREEARKLVLQEAELFCAE
jgi:hypothetical protein